MGSNSLDGRGDSGVEEVVATPAPAAEAPAQAVESSVVQDVKAQVVELLFGEDHMD